MVETRVDETRLVFGRRLAAAAQVRMQNPRGEVTIGLSIAAHLRLLPGSLRPFRDRHPKIRLHVIEGFYPTLAPGLQDGGVDFYIGPDPGLRFPAALKKETLLTSKRAVLCRMKHPLAGATSLKGLRARQSVSYLPQPPLVFVSLPYWPYRHMRACKHCML